VKPSRMRRRGKLPALLALVLMAGYFTAGGARYAAESTRLGKRISFLESLPVSAEKTGSVPPRENGRTAAERPDNEPPLSGYTAGRRLLKLLGAAGVEIASYSLEPETKSLRLSGSAESESLLSFFTSLRRDFPDRFIEEFEISRDAGEQKLHFSFFAGLRNPDMPDSDRSRGEEKTRKVLALFTAAARTEISVRRDAAREKIPMVNLAAAQPAEAPPALRYIGSAVVSGTLRLYLMDDEGRQLTRLTPDTMSADTMTALIENGILEKMTDENQITLADHCLLRPHPAASDDLPQPRP
jgi:hypothetical protein